MSDDLYAIPEDIPAEVDDVDGYDLRAVVAAYTEACQAGDLLWSLQTLHRLVERAVHHQYARLDEADMLGYGWEEIGQVFGLDADMAYTVHGGFHGPPPPDGFGSQHTSSEH